MSKQKLGLNGFVDEPLRPANSATVCWSFGLGLVMLLVLVIASHL